MYSALSVAFAIATLLRIGYVVRFATCKFGDVAFVATTAGFAALMAFRYRETELTFRQSVANLHHVSNDGAGAFASRQTSASDSR